MERERNIIRTEERTRMAAKLVENVAHVLLDDLQDSGCSSGQSSGNKKQMSQREQKKPQKHFPKNNQRGSHSLSSLNNISEARNSSAHSGSKHKNANFQNTFRAPQNASSRTTSKTTPRAPLRDFPRETAGAPPKPFPRAPPSAPPSYQNPPPSAPPFSYQDAHPAPPTYEESLQHQNLFPRPPLMSAAPALLNNPYMNQGYAQNYPNSGSGYHVPHYFSQPKYHPPPPPRPFYSQNKFQYNNPQQKSFPGTGNTSQKAQAPKPIPRTTVQKESKNTDPGLDSKQKQDKDSKVNIDINVIVRKLSDCDRYFCFLKQLSMVLDVNSSDILKIVKEKDDIFSSIYDPEKKDSVVELCPKIKLCKNHQEKGCITKDCCKIHLCEDFIFSDCTRKDCPLGHLSTFKSNHNVNILKKYYMAILPNATLQQLFQKVCSRTVPPQPPQICFDYHYGKCLFADNCRNIHICYSYVNNLGLCSNEDCYFSHNIRDPKVILTFKALGVSTNESPRDLLKVLKDMCIEKKEKYFDTKDLPKTASDSDNKQDSDSLDKDSKKAENKKTKEAKKSANTNQETTNTTSFCGNFYGAVKKPKVCMDGMKQKCKFLHNGCFYLHCRHKAHWQFGKGDKWYNFHLYHSQILDSKFSDPNCENVDLPKLDYARLTQAQKNLITLLGKKNLKVDFEKMTLYCESLDTTYLLRNLTTDSSVLANDDDDDVENYTIFKWYFKDNDEQYKLFDNSDFSSSIIEKSYIKDPKSIVKFKSANFSYSIDFTKMTQENDSSQKIRSLKRRPFITRNEKVNDKKKEPEEKIQLPKTWDEMKNESFKKVKLSSSDQEYMDLRQILCLSLPEINILNVWRVQNVFLWQKFTNKKIALEKQYKDSFLNVQKLFHGIDSDSVDDIIRENFEFRRHIITSNRPYGEGTYFYNSASAGASTCCCSLNSTAKKTLLIAEVIIGKVAQGSPGLTRPPENPNYNCMYDTTTDNIQSPSVYVKYSTLEYYPAYIVEFI